VRVSTTRIATHLALALMANAVGCRRPERHAAETAAPSATASGEAFVRSPASPEATSPSASSSARALDDAGWPEGAKRFRLTWVLYPIVIDPRGEGVSETPRRKIELVLGSGSASRRVSLEARQTVVFGMPAQDRCSPSQRRPPGEVANLFLNGGGNLWFAARVSDNGVLTVSENEQADGLCEGPRGCPVTTRVKATITVVPGATFEEHFLDVRGKGEEVEEKCQGAE
jgi:hypothetical protein